MYIANVLLDSVSPDGVRLTTFEVEYPHAIHKDIMTHRMLSRNFQSFRAFPPEKVIANIVSDPFIPEAFDYRVKGMGQGDALDSLRAMEADAHWRNHIEWSLQSAEKMMELDIAKAQVNFVLQDLTWIRGIITATEWENFFALRLDLNDEGKPKARPEVFKIASMMKEAMDNSTPELIEYGQWHIPLIGDGYIDAIQNDTWDKWKKIGTGRIARVSYLTHLGKNDPDADINLHDGLRVDMHMSPFEHVARPFAPDEWDDIERAESVLVHYGNFATKQQIIDQLEFRGNFRGWHQYRKDIPYEENYARA